jgi:DNA-binding GntR family transcriptional regulator
MKIRTRAKDAYHEIREAIVDGRFQPNERLIEASLAELTGTGRTSVRAALVRLDQEGLVVLEPNRGARVRHIGVQEALETEEIRAALEGLLTRRAAERMTNGDLSELEAMLVDMREHVHRGDAIGYSELNGPFHQVIWAAADHQTATRIMSGLKSQSIRFQYQTALRPGRAERSLHEHESIVEALRRRDADAAETAMRAHLSEVLETLRWAIESQRRGSGWRVG